MSTIPLGGVLQVTALKQELVDMHSVMGAMLPAGQASPFVSKGDIDSLTFTAPLYFHILVFFCFPSAPWP